MHFVHNTTGMFWSAVWTDIDTLHAEPHVVKYELLCMLCDMGVTLFRPACSTRDDKSYKHPCPKLRGGDISILRTDMGMLAILQLVYPVAARLAPEAPAPPPPRELDAREAAMVARGNERRLRAAANDGVAERAQEAALSKLELACKAIVALFEMHQVYKDTTYTHSADVHASLFEDAWARFEAALRAMTSKMVVSQYFTTAREVMPKLIRLHGKVVAYVNEQVQEHAIKVGKSIYKGATNHAVGLQPYVRALASGRTIKVTPRSTAYSQMLCRLVGWHAAMSAPTENRTAMRKLAGWGSAMWQAKEAAPTHDLLAEYAETLARDVEAADAEPAE